MLPLLETAIAFAVAMLAASLFVSAVVQVLQKLVNYRNETVAQMLSDQVSGGGVNYLIGSFMFGTMPHAEAVASIRRFAEDVMPAVKEEEAVAA